MNKSAQSNVTLGYAFIHGRYGLIGLAVLLINRVFRRLKTKFERRCFLSKYAKINNDKKI